MDANKRWLAAGFAVLVLLSGSGAVRAGDLSGAHLGCAVDTFAFDILSADVCSAWWQPNRANNPTNAHFEVMNLPAGNYAYLWRNLENNQSPPACAGLAGCSLPIATDTSGDGEASMSLTVTDLDTGAQRTLTAVAYYFDGHN